MYHKFMLLHTIQKLLYATHLPNSCFATLLHAFLCSTRKQLPEMRKFAANVMELAKNIVKIKKNMKTA